MDYGPLWIMDPNGLWTLHGLWTLMDYGPFMDYGPLWIMDPYGLWTLMDYGPLWTLMALVMVYVAC